MTPEERFWSKVNKAGPGGCWLWTGHTVNGYGRDGSGRRVHRVAYEELVTLIPEGLHLDHLCRVRNCVNPEHLEPVTNRENVLRGIGLTARYARKTHCPQGHPYSGENLVYHGHSRHCRICRRAQSRRYRQKKRLARSSEPSHE